MENKGTVHISPTGMLEIKDMLGRVIERKPLDSLLGIVVPGKPVTITVPTQILFPILGWDSATVAIYYSPTNAAVSRIAFVLNSWSMYGIVKKYV